MKYKIEEGVEMVEVRGAKIKYPFDDIAISEESFFVPHSDATTESVRASAFYHAKKGGKKFVTRSVDGGTRVWRIS